MMLKEVISHSLDENRGIVYANVILVDEGKEMQIGVEFYIDDLEEYCDLYEDVNWMDYDEYDDTSVTLQRNLNIVELEYGLSEYIKDNPIVSEF